MSNSEAGRLRELYYKIHPEKRPREQDVVETAAAESLAIPPDATCLSALGRPLALAASIRSHYNCVAKWINCLAAYLRPVSPGDLRARDYELAWATWSRAIRAAFCRK